MLRLPELWRNSSALSASWLYACFLCLSSTACVDQNAALRSEPEEGGELSVSIRLSKPAADLLARVEVVVTAPDMEDIREDLTITGESVSGTVTSIPAGTNRLFTLDGYDSSENLVYTGSARADVTAGQQVTVGITMRRVSNVPKLRIASPVAASRSGFAGNEWTIINGEVENYGDVDATNVVVDFTARTSTGVAASEAQVTVGTIVKGDKEWFSARFDRTAEYSSSTEFEYVTNADYTISYGEGEPYQGNVAFE